MTDPDDEPEDDADEPDYDTGDPVARGGRPPSPHPIPRPRSGALTAGGRRGLL